MLVHKVEVIKGKIVRKLNKDEDSCSGEVKYIASLQEPKIGDNVSKYFEYTSMVECKNVMIRYYQAL